MMGKWIVVTMRADGVLAGDARITGRWRSTLEKHYGSMIVERVKAEKNSDLVE